jgi:hypothetical protein
MLNGTAQHKMVEKQKTIKRKATMRNEMRTGSLG